ncbi:uncharacterized protein LOC136066384 [Quercus suber]|uniref:uncharacterized protein LOC136066384 n=1 Tax=Quercus suber TaxID=58331 RepID=UPI0032DED6A3
MAEMLLKVQKYMNAEDALAAIKDEDRPGTKEEKKMTRRGQKRDRPDRQISDGVRKKDDKNPRTVKFTPSLCLLTKFWRRLRTSIILSGHAITLISHVRDQSKYCRFHKDHATTLKIVGIQRADRRVDTEGEVAEILKRGNTANSEKKTNANRGPPPGTTVVNHNPPKRGRENTDDRRGPTTGGSFKSLKKTHQRQVNSVHVAHLPKQRRTDQDMTFNESDSRGVKQPHNDPLVIKLTIERFKTKRVLVDNGSSVDIIYFSAFQQLKLDPNRLRPFDSPLVSFSGDRVYPRGIVTLTITVGTDPNS